MNPLPPNADELVSAYLDGEAAPDEIVTVESNAELMARVEEMRAVSAQLGGETSPAPALKEAHLAAALGAFDELFAAAPATAPATGTQPAQETAPPVASLDAARERRKPRRFNSGVIAAAAAALLLIAGFTALSLGRTGTSQSSDVAFEAAGDAAESASFDDAMEDEEEAMEEEEAMADESFGGLAEADSDDTSGASANAQPAATAAPEPAAAQAAPVEDTVETESEDAMDDAEEAMEEAVAADGGVDADAERVSSLDALDALDLEITPFFFGEYTDLDELSTALTDLSATELDQRKGSIGEGIFARCQSLIDELARIESPTLIGDAFVDARPREIHVLTTESGDAIFYVVNPADDCSIVATFP